MMTTEQVKGKCFDNLDVNMQEQLKQFAKQKNMGYIDAFMEAIDAAPTLPAPDACHRYIEDHRAAPK